MLLGDSSGMDHFSGGGSPYVGASAKDRTARRPVLMPGLFGGQPSRADRDPIASR